MLLRARDISKTLRRMEMIVDTSIAPAIFIVVGLYWNTSKVLLLAVTSPLSGLKVALIFSNIVKFLLCLTRKSIFKK